MKHAILFLILTLSLPLHQLMAQSTRSIEKNEWLLSIGVNAINNQGTQSPADNVSDFAFRNPLAIGVETKWNRLFSVELAGSINGFKEGANNLDSGPAENNITYWAIDTNLKYYFGEYLFPKTEWLDFYGLAGIGYFHITDGNLSGNLGGGAMFWFGRSKSFGLKAQALAKLAFDHSDQGTNNDANNHFQFQLQAVIRL